MCARVGSHGLENAPTCEDLVQRQFRATAPNELWLTDITNGLLRQYFPKGTYLARWAAEEIEAVAAALNARPRKTLGWRTPAEAFDEHLRSLQQAGVATID